MSLKKPRKLLHTLAFRLTLWYGGIFALSAILAFVLVYLLLVAVVQEHTDDDLEGDIEEFAVLLQRGGLERVRNEIDLEVLGEGADAVFFRMWDSTGKPVLTSDLSDWEGLESAAESQLNLNTDDDPIIETLVLPEREYPVRSIFGVIGPGLLLQIGESMEDDEEFLAAILKGFVAVLLVVILLGVPIGWFMARRALGGVGKVTQTAVDIANGALDQRVEVSKRGDELDHLATVFNTMLDRIQGLILGMREMTDNLAHDLRSPVARIRAASEMALNNGGTEAGWEALASDTTEECDRLLEMINTTLDIAEAESGAAKLKLSEIELPVLIEDVCDLFQTVAEDKSLALVVKAPEDCSIQGDLQKLQRVLANLLDNAIKYTNSGGKVSILLDPEDDWIRLTVADTGIGILPQDTPKIFQRFYRCDWSRSRFGNGLGLSLALAFVRAHGGNITVNSTPGQGSTFTVLLPRSPRGHLT